MVNIHPGLVIVTHYKDVKSLLGELLLLFLTLLASRVTLPSELLQQDENLPATQITQQAKCQLVGAEECSMSSCWVRREGQPKVGSDQMIF